MYKSFFFGFGLCLLLLTQCTMQKRVYQKGWYISFKKEWRNPDNDQKQQFVLDDQQKEITDLAKVSDFSPVEKALSETNFNDTVPQSNSAMNETETPVPNILPSS